MNAFIISKLYNYFFLANVKQRDGSLQSWSQLVNQSWSLHQDW